MGQCLRTLMESVEDSGETAIEEKPTAFLACAAQWRVREGARLGTRTFGPEDRTRIESHGEYDTSDVEEGRVK